MANDPWTAIKTDGDQRPGNRVTAFLGEGQREFALDHAGILELERKLGTGIGTLCKRLFAGNFGIADIAETIRLAAIGAGTEPKEAADLITAYVVPRPIMETYPLAVAILELAWFGEVKGEA